MEPTDMYVVSGVVAAFSLFGVVWPLPLGSAPSPSHL